MKPWSLRMSEGYAEGLSGKGLRKGVTRAYARGYTAYADGCLRIYFTDSRTQWVDVIVH
jgi:hypothetical protein